MCRWARDTSPPKANAGRTVAALIDAINESYAVWCRDIGTVREAYKVRCNATRELDAESYFAYLAALDQEDAA